MWQRAVKPYVESGRLTVVGVVQEQHPDRTKLYAQWRKYDFPIFVDSLNLLDLAVVPVVVGIDESGLVRQTRINPRNFVKKFVDGDDTDASVPDGFNVAKEADLQQLESRAKQLGSAEAWRNLGDACFLASLESGKTSCDAIAVYETAVELDPKDGRAQFRLGVALRRRYESRARRRGDGQGAVDRWGLALAINPNQYIWRRRIQQYGPRLDKPYNFYFWVDEARKEITARGETPVSLAVEPLGSELAPPVPRDQRAGAGSAPGEGFTLAKGCAANTAGLQRDTLNFVIVDTIVTPARVQPGHRVRVRTNFRINDKTRPYWNNEADDLAMCVDPPARARISEASLSFPNPADPETREPRTLEFEVAVDESAEPGPLTLTAYALYYVCENKGGKCRYLRKDFTATINVDPNAPTIR